MSTKEDFHTQIQMFIKTHLNTEIEDISMFERALTHKSYLNDYWLGKDSRDYDSLEFLGDVVIGWVISNNLFDIASTSEVMTKLRQQIIQSKSLVITAEKINLHELIRTGKSLKNSATQSIIGDVFESFCAAIYLSLGLDKVREFINRTLWNNFLSKEFDKIIDYKTLLQEIVHKNYKTCVQYLHTKNNEQFTVICKVLPNLYAESSGSKLKEIEQQCAKQLLLNFLKH